MPPLAFTHAKYAFAMFGMSVNDVPGWLVAMAPSAIGVPVAATPGLVPHCVVLTADVLAELVAVDVLAGALELLLLLTAAAASGGYRDGCGEHDRSSRPFGPRGLRHRHMCSHLSPSSVVSFGLL